MTSEIDGFAGWHDTQVSLRDGEDAYFGLDVLRGLVSGLQAAASARRTERSWGPGVLASTMWMDDPELIEVLGRMANICVVVTKQHRAKYERPETQPLRDLATSNGLAHDAYPELFEYAIGESGEGLVVGPGTPNWRESTEIHAVREVGFRKSGQRLVPIVHAKIALLGRMRWTDEHPSGYAVDQLSFEAERLWIGSANFTRSSRRGLEMGMWTTDAQLMAGAREFLLNLVAISEPLGTGPDTPAPELLPVSYDDAAMSEALRPEPAWEDDDWD
ncbi:MAG TPA: hypothetical protein VIJ07_12980 [Dermatophilaceae bacterium]